MYNEKISVKKAVITRWVNALHKRYYERFLNAESQTHLYAQVVSYHHRATDSTCGFLLSPHSRFYPKLFITTGLNLWLHALAATRGRSTKPRMRQQHVAPCLSVGYTGRLKAERERGDSKNPQSRDRAQREDECLELITISLPLNPLCSLWALW